MNKLRKAESSSLQLSLPFETPETTAKESDTDKSLKKFDELSEKLHESFSSPDTFHFAIEPPVNHECHQ